MHKARQAIAVQKAIEAGELPAETAKEVMAGKKKLREVAPKVEAVIRDDPEALAAFREAMKHQGKADDFSYNVRESPGRPKKGGGNAPTFSKPRDESKRTSSVREQRQLPRLLDLPRAA